MFNRQISVCSKLLLSLALVCTLLAAHASTIDYGFRNTPEIGDAYEELLAFRFNDARQSLSLISSTDPGNLLVPYLEDYCDFIELFLSEDEDDYDRLKSRRSERIELLRTGPESSPWYNFTLAEVYLHWGLIRLKYSDYLSAAADVNRAFRLLKKNVEEHPGFGPSYKNLGMLKMAVGTIPDKYLWAVKLFSSLEGTTREGMSDLDKCMDLCEKDELWLLPEVQYLYAEALIHFMNDISGARRYLEALDLNPSTNDLHAFLLASTVIKDGDTDRAIEILKGRQRPDGVYPIHYLDLMLGRALLYKGDESADKYTKRFLNEFEGVNYVKEAYQKLAWSALLNGDRSGYHAYMDSCNVLGDDKVGEDKNALKEAKQGLVPETDLLRVRLRFDGGYFDKARAILDAIDPDGLSEYFKLEYEYRSARLLHEMGDIDKALDKYALTIRMGLDDPRYFACNSALQSGLIYEQAGKNDAAINSFRKCLSISPDDYGNSLHQKAKAGLNRLKTTQ